MTWHWGGRTHEGGDEGCGSRVAGPTSLVMGSHRRWHWVAGPVQGGGGVLGDVTLGVSTHRGSARAHGDVAPVGSPCPRRCPGRFKATLWLCEQHPLSLAEQVTPIIDLMAISNAHFAKLRDFITLKLPPGFPVKIGEGGTHRVGEGHGEQQGEATDRCPLSPPSRDPPLPRAQRPHHLQQPLRVRPAAGLRAGVCPHPAPWHPAPWHPAPRHQR